MRSRHSVASASGPQLRTHPPSGPKWWTEKSIPSIGPLTTKPPDASAANPLGQVARTGNCTRPFGSPVGEYSSTPPLCMSKTAMSPPGATAMRSGHSTSPGPSPNRPTTRVSPGGDAPRWSNTRGLPPGTTSEIHSAPSAVSARPTTDDSPSAMSNPSDVQTSSTVIWKTATPLDWACKPALNATKTNAAAKPATVRRELDERPALILT